MKPTSNAKEDPFKAILTDLNSGNDEKVISAIKSLREKGNDKTTRQLIRLLTHSHTREIEQEIIRYLLDLKDEAAIGPIMEAIEDPDLNEYKSILISVFWQSSLDASHHLMFFVDQVYQATYLETLEILTVVENFKGPFTEEELFEAIARLNELADEEEDEQKLKLISGMIEVLNQY